MGNIPQVNHTDRIPVTITLHDHLADHHFMGTPVLPAVEAMEMIVNRLKKTKSNAEFLMSMKE